MSMIDTMKNKNYTIADAVNHWKAQKTWGRVLNELGFTYRKEPTDTGGTRFIVTEPHNPGNVYAVAEEYANGESGEISDLSPHMLGLLNVGDIESLDRQTFVCFYKFDATYNQMLKKEILPFYEQHLLDLEAEYDATEDEDIATEDDATENNTNSHEETIMKTQSETYDPKYAEECGPDSIVALPYIDEMIEDFHERGYDEIDSRFRYLIDSADAESVRVFVEGLGIDYPVSMFVNDISKDSKYIQDHANCGEKCIVPEAQRIALANADEHSLEFEMMF